MQCYLCDFGLSKKQVSCSMTANIGTVAYMAPELFTSAEALNDMFKDEDSEMVSMNDVPVELIHSRERLRYDGAPSGNVHETEIRFASIDIFAFGVCLNCIFSWEMPFK